MQPVKQQQQQQQLHSWGQLGHNSHGGGLLSMIPIVGQILGTAKNIKDQRAGDHTPQTDELNVGNQDNSSQLFNKELNAANTQFGLNNKGVV